MELDDLKQRLASKDSSNNHNHIRFYLRGLTRFKPSNPVDKLRKKLIIEYLVGFPVIILMIITLAKYSEYISNLVIWTFLILIAVVMISTGWYIIKIYNMVRYNENTKIFLQSFIKSFRFYLHLAERSIFIVVPVFYFLGYISGLQWTEKDDYLDIILHPLSLLIMLTIMISVTIGLYYLVKFFYRKYYGKHLNELQQIIDDIDQNNS